MGNLLVSLFNTANAIGVYNRALETTENNVTNVNTPGYAKQIQVLTALPFDPSVGLPGGVAAGPTESTRNAFAESSVRDQQSQLGYHQQIAADLSQIEAFFDPSSNAGIPAAVSALFQSFSQLSINPNDTVSRQAVLDKAKDVAQTFRHTFNGITGAASAIGREMRSGIDTINRLAGQIAEINATRRANALSATDAGTDATLNSDLEELSQWVDFNALQQPDGSVTVYIGGQTPLVIGNRTYDIQADFSGPQIRIVSAQGADITNQIHAGKLMGLLHVSNEAMPSYVQDLNTMAQAVADQVNGTLANGLDQNGGAPAVDLFSYDPALGAAATLDVSDLTPQQIAAALPDAPGGNGNALALAALASSKPLNGYSFAQFYGNLSGRVGRDLSTARDDQTVREQLLTQAQRLRNQISSVSLDEEATHLIAFQRAYQATSKMLTVLNDLTDTMINIIR